MYSYFDTHCDTLLKLYRDGRTLSDTWLHVNYEAMSSFESTVQCFALYNDGSLKLSDFFDAAHLLKKECDASGRMEICTDTYGIDKVLSSGKAAALLSIEALGNTSDFKPDDIFLLKKAGYIMSGPVWNDDNPLCGGASGKNTGLTSMGEAVLKNMEKAFMVADISHMSEKGLNDTLDVFCKPPVASHSNSAYICPHKRNLSDESIVRIAERGGTVGLTVYPDFVGCGNSVDDIVAHADHIIALGGEGCVCIGADLDGIDKTVGDIGGMADISLVFEAFARHNYPKKLIKDISFNNIYNIFKKYEI